MPSSLRARTAAARAWRRRAARCSPRFSHPRGCCPRARAVARMSSRSITRSTSSLRPAVRHACRGSASPPRSSGNRSTTFNMKRSTCASGSGYVPSWSIGFCVASTRNGSGSVIRLVAERDLPLLHRFEQRALHFGGRAIDFIREHDVGEDRALARACTCPSPRIVDQRCRRCRRAAGPA